MATIGNPVIDVGLYRTVGAGTVKAISVTMPEDGTAVSIRALIGASAGGDSWQCAIYSAAGSLLDSTEVRTGISGGHSSQAFTGLTVALSNATQYFIAITCSANVVDGAGHHGAAEAFDGRSATGGTINPMASSLTFGADSSRDYDIELTYTPGGSPPITDGPKLLTVRSNLRLN